MNSIRLTYRRLRTKNVGTLLGIAGLIIGLICVIYIFMWTSNEISYDRFNENLDRMFVVHAYLEGEGASGMQFPGCPPVIAPTLIAEYPEVENACRHVAGWTRMPLSYNEVNYEEHVDFVDFSVFDIFTLPFALGNKGEEGNANQIVLSEKAALKYFKNENPIGKVLLFNKDMPMTVVGILKDVPEQSTVRFDILVPIKNMETLIAPDFLNTWYNNGFFTIGLLKDASSYDKLTGSITKRIQQDNPESTNYLATYKFKDRYLYLWKNIEKVRIYAGIGLLILLTAIFNFINLLTARSVKQSRESGIRKTLGATRFNLIKLYYTDIAFICTLSFLVALMVALTGIPLFNQLMSTNISYKVLLSPLPILLLLTLLGCTILFSGSYPALHLSSFSPLAILYSGTMMRKKGWLRNFLIVFMFSVSIILLSSTYIIWKQSRFLLTMDLGYAKEELLYVELTGELQQKREIVKEKIKTIPNVLSVSESLCIPTGVNWNSEGFSWEGKEPDFRPLISMWHADNNLLQTIGADLVEGDFPSKGQQGGIINQTLARLMEKDSFVGKTISQGDYHVTILGVMKDISFNSLQEESKPLLILFNENVTRNYLLVRAKISDLPKVVTAIKNIGEEISGNKPINYGFMSDKIANQLKSNFNMSKLVGAFSIFGLLVLSLGIMGVVMFLIEQKTKEIAIRKCLGESIPSIIHHIIKPFLILGLVATWIAAPLSWYVMSEWLQDYHNHILLSPVIFVLSGFIVTLLAILIVAWQSWYAANVNPIEELKRE